MILSDAEMENALLARLELVAAVLWIKDEEISKAIANDDGLIAFAGRYHQSLDWLVLGDLRGMIASRHRGQPQR